MNRTFEELKARILSDLKGSFPPNRFRFGPDRDGFFMACVAASAEDKPDDWPTEGYIPHAMERTERAEILHYYQWGMRAIESGRTLAGKSDSGELTPRQVGAAHVLAWAGMVTAFDADVIFLETKNAHECSGENEALLFKKREERKSSFENLKNAFSEYRDFLPADEAERFAKLFAPETTPATRPVPRQRAQEAAILETLRRQGINPQAMPKLARGKAGPKAQLRRELPKARPDLFQNDGMVTKAWERLRASGDVMDQ